MTTGPFYDNFESDAFGISRRKTWHRQAPPFKKPLPYQHGSYRGKYTDYNTSVTSPGIDRRFYGSPYYIGTQWLAFPGEPDAYKTAYDRFVAKARSDTASLGTTVVEARESFNMIHARTLTLLRSLRAIRRGDVGSLIKELKLDDKGSRKAQRVFKSRSGHAANAANHYLEYIFGWMPLVSDIADSVKVLQSDYSPTRVSARGKVRVDDNYFSPYPWGFQKQVMSSSTRLEIRASVAVSNPNLALANNLGFVNPASIAFEVIPGSFLLDWFVPIGRFLESWTDFVGYSLSDITVSRSCSTTRSWEQWNPGNLHGVFVDEAKAFERTLRPTLYPPEMKWFRLPGADSARSKAASVVALAVQAFTPKR